MSALLATLTVLADIGYGGPDEWKYVLAGWGLIVGGLVVYAVAIVLKGRQLSRELPPEDRRWMS